MTEVSIENVTYHEFIGLRVSVKDSSCKEFIGFSGKVIDETKNTLKLICDDNKVRVLPKYVCKFVFNIPQGKVLVDGKDIVGRPEDRVSRLRKRAKVIKLE
jgi:ribonuclease P protein subunit POP4